MKKSLLFATILSLISINVNTQAQNTGEELYKSVCAACHTINKGRLVGPDLVGVSQKMDRDWLIQFIRSSQEMIKSGDSAAVAIFNEYNKIPMPDNNFSEEQIISILEYIDAKGNSAPVASVGTEPIDSTAISPALTDSIGVQYSDETIELGRALYNGYTNFANGGSPCSACHNINDQSLMGGGMLALDLTGSYEKLGAAGIKAIIANPPFPAMKVAMLDHALEDNEIEALVALLKSVADRNSNNSNTNSGGMIFIVFGLIAVIFLVIHIYLLYDNRKIA